MASAIVVSVVMFIYSVCSGKISRVNTGWAKLSDTTLHFCL